MKIKLSYLIYTLAFGLGILTMFLFASCEPAFAHL